MWVELRFLVGRFTGMVVLGPGRKRIRLDRKPPCTPRGFRSSISATGVEETASCWAFFLISFLIARGGEMIRMIGDMLLLSAGTGVG